MLSIHSLGDLLMLAVCILLALSLHEAMHAYAGHALGDTTAKDMGRLTLNPLKHIDIFTTVLLPVLLIALNLPPLFAAKPVPFNPDRVKYDEFGAAMVGLAGPFTNLILAIVSALALRALHPINDSLFVTFLVTFTAVNVGFFIFNMIPFPPLDGSRLLYAFAPEFLQNLMRQIESLGFTAILLFVFFVIPLLGNTIVTLNQKLLSILLG
jgi:Zn-dependent protease